ncbi:MAG: hypothetical protein AAF141_07640 [Pseudomonadota bacterium]
MAHPVLGGLQAQEQRYRFAPKGQTLAAGRRGVPLIQETEGVLRKRRHERGAGALLTDFEVRHGLVHLQIRCELAQPGLATGWSF